MTVSYSNLMYEPVRHMSNPQICTNTNYSKLPGSLKRTIAERDAKLDVGHDESRREEERSKVDNKSDKEQLKTSKSPLGGARKIGTTLIRTTSDGNTHRQVAIQPFRKRLHTPIIRWTFCPGGADFFMQLSVGSTLMKQEVEVFF